jgi:hypothetical protein
MSPADRDSVSWWVAAVSGNIACSFCSVGASESFHSAMLWIDARTGLVHAMVASSNTWPSTFDGLSDELIDPNSATATASLVRVNLPNEIVVRLAESLPAHALGSELTLRSDSNTQYSWAAGLAHGNAISLRELAQSHDLDAGTGNLVRITFVETPTPDGVFPLESLQTGVNTK